MKVNAHTVSAFTANGQGGNKAGVVLNAEQLATEEMQTIAEQLAFSETAFVLPSKEATHRVRFFTSSGEVDVCGHATIATWTLLHQRGLGHGTYSQETLAGNLDISIDSDGPVFMQQTSPHFFEKVPRGEVAASLGIADLDFRQDLEPQIVSTGLRDILVPVLGKNVLSNLVPNFDKITELSKEYDVTGLHVFALSGNGNPVASARNFAPRVGINEESATGTSNGALLCYLRENGMLAANEAYSIEQGENMGSPSQILGKFTANQVWVGGRARILGHRAVNL